MASLYIETCPGSTRGWGYLKCENRSEIDCFQLTLSQRLVFVDWYYRYFRVWRTLSSISTQLHSEGFWYWNVWSSDTRIYSRCRCLCRTLDIPWQNWMLVYLCMLKGMRYRLFTDLRKIKLLEMHHNGLRATPLGLNLIASTVMTLNFAYNSINSLTSMEGVEFNKLVRLRLSYNEITHLHPEFLITPHLQVLNLVGNQLVSLAEVTQFSWGSSLPEHKYMSIALAENRWHCNGSLIWTSSNLYRIGSEIIYAKPPFKPCIRD